MQVRSGLTGVSAMKEDAMIEKCWALGLVVAAAACGPTAATEVKGDPVNVALIAGKWAGTYEGIDSGRKGVIHFDLVRGYGVVEGKVIMNASDPTRATTLTIKFLETSKGKIVGRLERYTDPACNCPVDTEFVGTQSGETFSGSFSTRPVGADKVQVGRWQVTRQPS